MDKKVEIYEQIIHFFFEVIFASKSQHNPKSEQEITDFLIKTTPKLIMWASDEVLSNFREFRQASFEYNSDNSVNLLELMLIYERMLLNIRKDLGHQNTGLKTGSILGLFVNDIDVYFQQVTKMLEANKSPQIMDANVN